MYEYSIKRRCENAVNKALAASTVHKVHPFNLCIELGRKELYWVIFFEHVFRFLNGRRLLYLLDLFRQFLLFLKLLLPEEFDDIVNVLMLLQHLLMICTALLMLFCLNMLRHFHKHPVDPTCCQVTNSSGYCSRYSM